MLSELTLTHNRNSHNRREIKRYFTAIYFLGFIISMITLSLGLTGDINSSIIYICTTFCFLIPLFIILLVLELYHPKRKKSKQIRKILKPEPVVIKSFNIIGHCIVCDLVIEENDDFITCPRCSALAHKLHLLEWIKIKGYCPNCNNPIKQIDLFPLQHQIVQTD